MELTGALARPERRRLLAGAVLLLVAGVLVGHAWGQREAGVTVRHGYALSAEVVISATAQRDGGGLDFAIPRDVPWVDADGSYHEDGRPACLPPVGIGAIEVTFATVRATDPSGVRRVRTVWVD